MKKSSFIFSFVFALFSGASLPALAAEAQGLIVAKSQFPAPRTPETELEWEQYNFSVMRKYIPGLVPNQKQVNLSPEPKYTDLDAEGRPMWYDTGLRRTYLTNLVLTMFRADLFDGVDQVFNDWTKSKEETASGRSKLVAFMDAMTADFSALDEWESEYARILRWKEKNPKSAAVAITEAWYWREYAFHARGDQFADEVDRNAWRLFEERSKKGEEALLASKSYASGNPLWYDVYLSLTAGLQWSKEEQLKLFKEAITKHPGFVGFYQTMGTWALPQWGGDWDLVEGIARLAEKASKDLSGAADYTRTYIGVVHASGTIDLFSKSKLDWPHMRQGFEDLMKRYPHSPWNLNRYAAFACFAGDGETFRNARQRIGDYVEPKAWVAGHSIDVCDRKFPMKKAELSSRSATATD